MSEAVHAEPLIEVVDWAVELAGCDTLESAVFQSLGAASVCWTPEGVFDSETAAEIGDALLELVRDYVR